jgi:CRISPR-associated endonuclease/helicase Cas3
MQKRSLGMKYLAHISETDCREQSILAHLQGTADLSEKFSAAFGAGQEGRLCGMLHDIGKYSDAFQQRLHGSQKQVDHSTAGAYEAWKLRNIPASFCVAGHHAGLPDFGSRGDDGQKATLSAKFTRAEKGKIEDYSAFFSEVTIPNAAVPKAFVPDAARRLLFYAHALFLPCGRGLSRYRKFHAKRRRRARRFSASWQL